MKIRVSRSAALAATMSALACVCAGYCAVTAFSIRLAFGFSRSTTGLRRCAPSPFFHKIARKANFCALLYRDLQAPPNPPLKGGF